MNGWLNEWRNKKYELMSKWDIENKRVNEYTVKQLNDRVHEWMNELKIGYVNVQLNNWMRKWMNKWLN